MTRRACWLVMALLVLAMTAATAPAQADRGAPVITYVEPSEEGLQVLVSMPPGTQVDLDRVSVTVDGADADAAARVASGSASVRRTAVLVIDTSNSMRGQRFRAARRAAGVYLSSVPEDVEVGLVTFSDRVEEQVPPTTDRAALRRAVQRLELSRRTRLYDGVLAGLEAAGKDGQRSLLVLSDGADTSATPLDRVTATIRKAEAQVDVVSLDQGAARAQRALVGLARAGGGRVIDASSGDLAATFSDQADVLARQVQLTVQVPAEVTAREASVEVTLGTADGDLVAESFAPVGTARADEPTIPPVVDPESSLLLPNWAPWAAAGLVGLAAAIVLATLAWGGRRERVTAADRIQQYAQQRRSAAQRTTAEDPLATAKGAAEQVLAANRSLEDRISTRLEAAGSAFKPAEWLLLHAGIAIGAALLGILLSGGSIGVGVLFLLVGAVLAWLYLGFKRSRRVKAFNAALPDTLQLMSGSLSAGMSLAQSVDTITREASDPMASEFKRVLVETRLGVPLEDALEGVAARFDSEDFAWVVMAIKIQRQVGGNLAELLDTVAGTIREREYLRRQVLALSAEGRLSAWVLGGLPPLFFLYLMLTQGEYLRPLYTTLIGWTMLVGAGVLLAGGAFWMSRMVKVQV